MLTLAIFDCDADELIIDPALRAKWHIDLISAHEVIDYGISAGIIAAFVKADILHNEYKYFGIYRRSQLRLSAASLSGIEASGACPLFQ